MQDDDSIGTAHHGRMILRTAIVNFISQIDFFLADQEQQVVAVDAKLCRLVSSALRSLHATLSYQAEHEEFRDNLVEYEFSTLIGLLMFKVYDKQTISAGLSKKWLISKKWALRLTSLLVELLTQVDGGSLVSTENEIAIRQLMNKLIRILSDDLVTQRSVGHQKEDRSSRAIVALAARLLNRLLSIEQFKKRGGQLNHSINGLALPLASKYVTDDRLYLDAGEPRVYLREFTLSYELESELQMGGDSQTLAPERKSAHSATTCLLVRLIELANQEDRTKILASLGPFYKILDRATSRAAAARDKRVCPTENPRELLVALIVIIRLEFDSEPSSQKCRQLFTKLVLLPILSASSGYLRARLYWLMQDFYCKTASLLPEVLASLVVYAYDDLSACDLVLQASAARFLQALLVSGDLKNLVARYRHLKQADIYSRVEAILSEKWEEWQLDDNEQHDWHWITKSQSQINT